MKKRKNDYIAEESGLAALFCVFWGCFFRTQDANPFPYGLDCAFFYNHRIHPRKKGVFAASF